MASNPGWLNRKAFEIRGAYASITRGLNGPQRPFSPERRACVIATDHPPLSYQASDTPKLFEAVLYPNRSLGQTGFLFLMIAIALVSGLVGAGFAFVGAWPVTGFLGLDVLLLYWAFRWNLRQSQHIDIISLDRDGLLVRRLVPGKPERSWKFEATWVQVVEEVRQLKLRSHGEELAIGAFLTVEERSSLAKALRSALRAYRDQPLPLEDQRP